MSGRGFGGLVLALAALGSMLALPWCAAPQVPNEANSPAQARPRADAGVAQTASPAEAQPTAFSAPAPAGGAPFAAGQAPAASPRRLSARIVEGSAGDPLSWAFSPQVITAKMGDTIIWTNDGSLPHTVTAAGGAFDSGILAKGRQWSHTASVAGTFNYACDLHPQMKGTLVVEATGGAPAQAAGPDAQTALESPTGAALSPPPTPAVSAVAPAGGRQLSAQIVAGGFNPATINASLGDRITWTNTDGRRHTVTASGGAFDSGTLASGARWSLAADRAGTFAYVCAFHPQMQGTLIVDAGAGSSAAPPAATGPPTGPAPAPQAVPGATKAEITLAGSAGYPAASGRARFESTGGETRFRVEVAGLATLRRTALDVLVGGSKVGNMAVTDSGEAKLDLERGKGAATVPTSVAGKTVEVRTGEGALVASGRFP